jgi:hypothetical protein
MSGRHLRGVRALLVTISCGYGARCGDVVLPEPSAALRVVEECEVPSSDQYYPPCRTPRWRSSHWLA